MAASYNESLAASWEPPARHICHTFLPPTCSPLYSLFLTTATPPFPPCHCTLTKNFLTCTCLPASLLPTFPPPFHAYLFIFNYLTTYLNQLSHCATGMDNPWSFFNIRLNVLVLLLPLLLDILKVDQSVNMPFRKIPRWRRQREESGASICHWKHRGLVLNLRPIFQSICVGGNWPRLAYFNWHAYSGYSQLNLLHSSALDKGFVWTLYSGGETGVQILRKCHRGENITHLLFLTWNFKP